MNITDIISSKIRDTIERSGEITLFIISTLLALNYFGFITLSVIPYLDMVLWCYILLNIGLANVFKYWRNKDNPTCPKCKKKLIKVEEYECKKCGKLKFEVK